VSLPLFLCFFHLSAALSLGFPYFFGCFRGFFPVCVSFFIFLWFTVFPPFSFSLRFFLFRTLQTFQDVEVPLLQGQPLVSNAQLPAIFSPPWSFFAHITSALLGKPFFLPSQLMCFFCFVFVFVSFSFFRALEMMPFPRFFLRVRYVFFFLTPPHLVNSFLLQGIPFLRRQTRDC